VTDYSSIAYDYSLVGGPIVFLAPDLEHYAKRRGLYLPYRAFAGGQQVASWPDALARLDAVGQAGSAAAAAASIHSRWLRDENFDMLDGRATERVLAETLRRSGVAAALGLTVAEVPSPATVRPRVTEIAFSEPSAASPTLTVTVDPLGREAETIRLDGARSQRVAASVTTAGGQATATFGMLSARWGTPDLAMPSGDYRLTLDGASDSGGGARASTARVEVTAQLPGELRHPLFRARVLATAGGLVLRVSPPLDDDERGGPRRGGWSARTGDRGRPPRMRCSSRASTASRARTTRSASTSRCPARGRRRRATGASSTARSPFRMEPCASSRAAASGGTLGAPPGCSS